MTKPIPKALLPVGHTALDLASMLALSLREQAIVELAIKGQNAPEIATNLGLPVGAVRAAFAEPGVLQAINDLRATARSQALAWLVHLEAVTYQTSVDLQLPCNPPSVRAKGAEIALRMGAFGDTQKAASTVNITNITAVQNNSVKLEITMQDLIKLGPKRMDQIMAWLNEPEAVEAEIV